MRFLILLSILIFFSSLIKGQTFTKEFQFCERSSYSRDIFETESGEIIGVGGFDYKCQLLYKLNSEGELLDSLILTSPTIGSIMFDSGQSLIEVNSDTFFYVTTIREDDIRTADILVTKFTATPFDTLFTKRYKIDDYQETFGISEINQGFRIFCRTDSINNAGGSSKGATLLLDIDKNGSLLNQRLYRDTFRFSGPGMSIQLPNNQTAIAYKRGDDDAALGENFLILDSTFQLIWEKGDSRYLESNRITPQLVLSEDSTTIYHTTKELLPRQRGFHGYVRAYNLDGSMIWDRFFCKHGFNIIKMIRARNGDLIGCGGWQDQNVKGRIFRLSKDGDLIFDRVYFLPDRDKDTFSDISEFYDIEETQTGNLLISGVSTKKDSFRWLAYTLKLDSSGCLTPSCDSISFEVECLVNTNEIVTTPDATRVVPNPANEIVAFSLPATVRRPKVNIVNATGQIVERRKELNDNTTLSVGHLPKGIYFFEVLSRNNERIGSGKFVVDR